MATQLELAESHKYEFQNSHYFNLAKVPLHERFLLCCIVRFYAKETLFEHKRHCTFLKNAKYL